MYVGFRKLAGLFKNKILWVLGDLSLRVFWRKAENYMMLGPSVSKLAILIKSFFFSYDGIFFILTGCGYWWGGEFHVSATSGIKGQVPCGMDYLFVPPSCAIYWAWSIIAGTFLVWMLIAFESIIVLWWLLRGNSFSIIAFESIIVLWRFLLRGNSFSSYSVISLDSIVQADDPIRLFYE